MTNEAKRISEHILEYMGKNNLTCKEMSEQMDVEYYLLYRWATGRQEMKVSSLYKLSKFMGVTMEELVT